MPQPPGLTRHSELLPDSRASRPVSKGEPSHPAEQDHFSRLYLPSCSFGRHPKLGRKEDRLVNRELRLSLRQRRVRITADAAPICPSIYRSILPSLVNKTPRYLNSSTWGRISSPTRRRQSTFFRPRTTASDLEVPILITLGCEPIQRELEVTGRWSQQDHVICKEQGPNPEVTKADPFNTLADRICDKGQPWRSPTLPRNEADILPAMRTRL